MARERLLEQDIATRIGFIRDLITTKVMEVVAGSTIDMVADPLTKPLGPIDFRRKLSTVMTITDVALEPEIAHHTTALTRGRVLSHAPHGHGHVRLRPTVRQPMSERVPDKKGSCLFARLSAPSF